MATHPNKCHEVVAVAEYRHYFSKLVYRFKEWLYAIQALQSPRGVLPLL